MRWVWIDKFTDFQSGIRATAIKNVSLAEEHLHDHFPGWPVMPASLIVEGMAQTAGILVGEARKFEEKVILAKVKRASFLKEVRPGDQLRYDAEIEHLTEEAAATIGRVTLDGEPLAEIDIVFSHIDNNMSGLVFPEENFVFTDEFKSLLSSYNVSTKNA
ncbi:MAG TPA: 3-hydroxyacyl-ACP dehydratase FabZ family protein [Phycisphaerae bacterium]|nr:3-hydroxyacyl-ACP dehydratase FabZ family protein [Phycisphaerae bacterium]HRW53376.1 3-hydroxyacyl-ACP dehydratase FabZ family protein [Phycisphaerae bacterium]